MGKTCIRNLIPYDMSLDPTEVISKCDKQKCSSVCFHLCSLKEEEIVVYSDDKDFAKVFISFLVDASTRNQALLIE